LVSGNANLPIGQDDNAGYNCNPANPYFVGWTNTYNVLNAMIGAAQTAGLTVFELDVSNELDLINFPVLLRLIIDNAQTNTGNPDSVDTLRYAMGTAHSFDPGRVTWSSSGWNTSVAGSNCTDVYEDYARNMNVDELVSGIAAGYIGLPGGNFNNSNGLPCAGTTTGMYQVTSSHTQGDIVDMHFYPCVTSTPGGSCNTADGTADVQSEAELDFGDVPHFLSILDLESAIFVLGETHSNTTVSGTGLSCEGAPMPNSPSETVNGYNASSLAGHTTYFRPWSNLASSCYSYGSNQEINANNDGPYTPTL
jgi:hypothetical protein